MEQESLSYADVSRLCRVSIHTIKAWLKPETSKSSNKPPDMAVELLYLKLSVPPPSDLDVRSHR